MTRRVAILTGTALRHDYVRKALAAEPGLDVVLSVCEGHPQKLRQNAMARGIDETSLALHHLALRDRAEMDFFAAFDRYMPDNSNPLHIGETSINDPDVVGRILDADPDVVVAYGCSIVKEPLLSAFKGRFLNVHLGISPYFRGAGTNFFCFVENLPECCGATFMHIDAGVDTGAVIHQIRPEMAPGDTIHTIGNRLIAEMVPVYAEIIRRLDTLEPQPQPKADKDRLYRQRDFTEAVTQQLYDNFAAGMIQKYLADKAARDAAFPIVTQPGLADASASAGAADRRVGAS